MNMDRMILHIDLNCCYGQIECEEHPELRDKPVVVAGKEELRHGIVMAKNQVAKERGIKTACTLREARQICPDVVVVPPNFDLYKRVSRDTRKIYYSYSDQVEPFGIDECWVDVTHTHECLGMTPEEIAYDVNRRVKEEIGLTTSVGLSWNKIFAKFGSDYKKPDAVTIITRDNYKDIVWRSKVRDLLYVGVATERRLNNAGIFTIEQLAHASDKFLASELGKMGFVLRDFANGNDTSPVKTFNPDHCDVDREIKSYGNGITFPRDIDDFLTAKAVTHMLAESVAQRMREDCVRAKTVSVAIRSSEDLGFISRQKKLDIGTNITIEICDIAWELMRTNWFFPLMPARGLYVTCSNLESDDLPIQLTIDDQYKNREKLGHLDKKIDKLRSMYGNNSIMWGAKASDVDTSNMDIKDDNTVHPISFFHD